MTSCCQGSSRSRSPAIGPLTWRQNSWMKKPARSHSRWSNQWSWSLLEYVPPAIPGSPVTQWSSCQAELFRQLPGCCPTLLSILGGRVPPTHQRAPFRSRLVVTALDGERLLRPDRSGNGGAVTGQQRTLHERQRALLDQRGTNPLPLVPRDLVDEEGRRSSTVSVLEGDAWRCALSNFDSP